MTAIEHTPGPWFASPTGPYVYAFNAHGTHRLHCTLNNCSVYGDDGLNTPNDELKANLSLIAEAPTLKQQLAECRAKLGAISGQRDRLIDANKMLTRQRDGLRTCLEELRDRDMFCGCSDDPQEDMCDRCIIQAALEPPK